MVSEAWRSCRKIVR